MANIKGECLCGAVAYKYEGPIGNLVHCHCSECRKWHGSPFRSRIVIESDGYEWTKGEEHLAKYKYSPTIIKTFCKICGSNLVTIYPKNEAKLGLPIAAVEGELGSYGEFHIFTGSKAKWYKITDDLAQYEGLPDNKDLVHCVNN
jgi:hypothetical protein